MNRTILAWALTIVLCPLAVANPEEDKFAAKLIAHEFPELPAISKQDSMASSEDDEPFFFWLDEQRSDIATGDLSQVSHVTTADHLFRTEAPCCADVCGVRCQGNCSESYTRFFGSIDYLFLRARRSGFDIAIADADNDNNVEGPVESLSFESHSGLRATLGARLGCNWDLGFTYTFFEADDDTAINAPGGGQLWLTRTNPASFNNFATSATANAQLKYHLYDIQAGYWFHPNQHASVRMFAGPRGADIEQSFNLNYAGGTIAGSRIQQQRTSMSGFGLRAGGEAHWRLGSALSLFGSAAGSVLVGDIEIDYLENESATPSGNVMTRFESFDTVPGLEIGAGVNLEWNKFSFQTGYELASWLNLDRRVNFTGSTTIMRGGLSTSSQDLLLDGLFVRMIYTR